ncbi:MAG: cytochrome P450, partial [Caulobacteraceae bacterium]
MADGALGAIKEAREEAYSMPLEDIDMSLGERFASDTFWPFFERLRAEAPVHYCKASEFGPYWSVTRYHDIVAVESNHEVFSSAKGISIGDNTSDFQLPMFIAMDPPKHDEQRKVVSPIVGTENLKGLAPLIRERAAKIIDELPVGETFDWVDRVSVELTAQMLATLFGFPFEERRKLTYWSDLTTTPNEAITEDEWKAEMMQCLARFSELWAERVAAPPAKDLISMLAHGEATREMPPMEFLGNVLLLIVGGNDTTRNSISGGLIALNRHPEAYERLRREPALIETMVPEIIRWQTPVAHMRRTATADFELGGQTIRAGDKVIMWYVSGNR